MHDDRDHEAEAKQQSVDSQNDATNRPRGDTLGRLARLCLKELREILRDRRTIVTLVLMPLLVYPLLSIVFQRYLLSSFRPTTGQIIRIGAESEQSAERIAHILRLGDELLERGDEPDSEDSFPSQLPMELLPGETAKPQIQWMVGTLLTASVASGEVDVAIRLETTDADDRVVQRRSIPETVEFEILYSSHSPISKGALGYVEQRLKAVNDDFVQVVLAQSGGRWQLPVHATSRSVADGGKDTVNRAFPITAIIPLILILMTITGAVYPAIDLTAGERERGTLEALMAAPVPRLGLLAAKYVAVIAVALLTASVNLLGMTITLLSTGLGTLLFGGAGLTLTTVIQVMFLLLLFAMFFSAVLLAITSFARSFKEAQAYLIPIMLLSLVPGVMSLDQGLKLNGILAVTPLANLVLLSRDVLSGVFDPALAAITILSTSFYAAAALGMAASVFGTDAVLYGSHATWSDMFRGPAVRNEFPTAGGAVVCLALLFPCFFIVSNGLRLIQGLGPESKTWLSACVTVLLFILLPALVARMQHVHFFSTFQLRRPSLLALAGSCLLGLSLWPLAHEIVLLNQWLGLTSLTKDQFEFVRQLLESWQQMNPALIVVCLAVIPAAGEEFFFRGYLFTAFRRNMSPSGAIITTAVLFGAFHVVVVSMLAVERLLPSTMIGLVLGWVAYRSRSIFPAFVLHACHNGLLLMIGYYQKQIMARGWGLQEQEHIPWTFAAGSVIAIAIGVGLILLGTRQPSPVPEDEVSDSV